MVVSLSRVTAVWCSCLTLVFLLLLHCCHASCQRADGALSVVENPEKVSEVQSDTEDEVTVEEKGDEDFDVVQPTEQWHTLKPDQTVPAGSHVRLNLQTGQREVRMGEEHLKYWTQQHRENEDDEPLLNPDELKKAMKKIKEDLKHVHKDPNQQFRSLEDLKKDMAELDLLVETDVQIMRRLLDQFNSSSTEERLNILLELEYMVHQVDNAQTLCSMGGLVLILEGLNNSDSRLQENSAFVLGSALASNPAVQVKAVESGALQALLTILATTEHFSVQKKVLFAVASLLRNFPFAQQHFLSNGGLQVLSELYRGDENGILRTRVVTLLHDIISEKELISREDQDTVVDASYEERVRQYSRVSLDRELVEKNWCSLVPQLLESSEHDFREKALRALLAMAPMCLGQYRTDSSLLSSLSTLRDHYQEMVHKERTLGEETGYFGEIVELIDTLEVKMK